MKYTVALKPHLKKETFTKRFRHYSTMGNIPGISSVRVSKSMAASKLKDIKAQRVEAVKKRISENYYDGVKRVKYLLGEIHDERTKRAAKRIFEQEKQQPTALYEQAQHARILKQVELKYNQILARFSSLYKNASQVSDIKKLLLLNEELQESLGDLTESVKDEIKRKEMIHSRIMQDVKEDRLQELEEAGVLESHRKGTTRRTTSIARAEGGQRQGGTKISSRREKAFKRMEEVQKIFQRMDQSAAEIAKGHIEKKMKRKTAEKSKRAVEKYLDRAGGSRKGHESKGWQRVETKSGAELEKITREKSAGSVDADTDFMEVGHVGVAKGIGKDRGPQWVKKSTKELTKQLTKKGAQARTGKDWKR